MSVEFSKSLTVSETPIPGLVVLDLPVHGDRRGWFKENWQRAKMTAAGLPDFGPVQNNISFNSAAGTTRGIHAEPWDKFVSVATGRIFGAWVDLRQGPTFGAQYTIEIDPSKAVFVPRGVGNAFQTLERNTVYTYLVNDHWSAATQDRYTFLNLADTAVGINWPIPLNEAQTSDKDCAHPPLSDVVPMKAKKTLIIGANGQLGRALLVVFSDRDSFEYADRAEFDVADPGSWSKRDWNDYSTIINAAAYTQVDEAETVIGRGKAWTANAAGPGELARVASAHGITLVHISSDYVFDGLTDEHSEDEPFTPLGVYGQSKAAGDIAVAATPKHFIIRTSWVIGEGSNFVATMASLARRGVRPSVVSDQTGRLSFTTDIARAIDHLLSSSAPYGTYNVTSSGAPQTWADIAKTVYSLMGYDPQSVTPVTTKEYYSGRPHAPRPNDSTLDLQKVQAAGFAPRPMVQALEEYLGR